MTASLCRLLASDAPAAVLLIRLLVGAVFVSEGIQKFLFPADLDVCFVNPVPVGLSHLNV